MMHGVFHGSSSESDDEEIFGKLYDQRVVRRIIPYVKPHMGMVMIATIAMLVYTCTQVAIPWAIKIAIDEHIVKGDSNLSGLAWIFAFFIVAAALNFASNYIQQIAMTKAGQGILHTLRGQMFSHVQRLSLSFFDRTEVGRIMSRVQGDVWQLQEFVSLVVMGLGDILALVGIVAAMLVMDIKLGIISMAVLPILVATMAFWQIYARRSFMRVRRTISIVNAAFNENISGVRVVQSMNRQDRNLEIFKHKNFANLEAGMDASRLSSGLMVPVDLLTGVAIFLALWFGYRMVGGNNLDIGVLIAFVLYIQRFFDPIRNLTMQYTQLQRSMASGVRIFDLLDTDPDVVDAPDAKIFSSVSGEVEFRNVSFSYVPGQPVLKAVNLHVAPGETLAIVGPTGSGKTTLASLLSRLYDLEQGCGAVMVDGQDIRDVTRQSLAEQVSVVIQEPFLFSGTVRENIKYSHPDIKDIEMIEAAKVVGAHGFILDMKEGYDTLLQERASNLSLGQRQLLAFARAIASNPRILVLDEATANIDSYTEMLIQSALRRVLKGRTAIVIAHRLSTIRGADKILVLSDGEVAEEGTHSQLMANEGIYAHLYQLNYNSIEELVAVGSDGDAG